MTDYSALKVVELKDLLKERGIPSTGLGRKQQIVEALEAYDVEHGSADQQEDHAGDTQEPDADPDSIARDEVPAAEAAAESEEEEAITQTLSSKQGNTNGQLEEALGERSEADIPPMRNERLRLASPSADSISSEAKKRKRRSPTPALSDSSIAKKLKTIDAPAVKLPEDRVAEEATAEIKGVADSTREETSEPMMDDLDTTNASHQRNRPEQPRPLHKDVASSAGIGDGADRVVRPALHPATEALYICNLVRPLQRQDLRDHIVALATPERSAMDDSVIEAFHLDSFRSHALVVLKSISAATRVRSLLHDHIWPDEPTRKPLWVDFVPAHKVRGWVDIELNSGSNRYEAKRWEVVYADDGHGMAASLQEASPAPALGPRAAERSAPAPSANQAAGLGMPNAPTGPRGSYRQPESRPRDYHQEKPPPPAPSPPPSGNSGSFDVLDERFKFTVTKPKLYYLPNSVEIVNRRLDELDALTSRDWDPKRDGSFSFQDSTLRRYTFEDGYRLVDGGADIGNFGKPASGMRRGGGGRGRGRP